MRANTHRESIPHSFEPALKFLLPLWEKVAPPALSRGSQMRGIVKHEFARKLRREQTDVERKLWHALRGRRFHAFKFRRQQPIGPYIADFVCFEAKLIIELDGSQHGTLDGRSADHVRVACLARDGFRVRRFWNHELIENFDGVLEAIWLELGSPETPMIKPLEPKPFRPMRYVRGKR